MIDLAQANWWRDFAAKLPRKARVLDLGTGDGIVLRRLHSARPDLKLFGIDSAAALPPGPKFAQLRPSVAIEDLPFGNGRFQAVVSQFGYEYSDTQRGAAEIVRVLAPGGKVGMIIHHREGPILAHNLERRDAIRWLIEDRKLLEHAVRFAETRQQFDFPTPSFFHKLQGQARATPAFQALTAEIVQAVVQTLDRSRGAPIKEVTGALQAIEAMGINESRRITALERAARSADEITLLVDELRAAGLNLPEPGLLSEESNTRPFAWLLTGCR